MSEQQTIKETLSIIRKALEEENHSSNDNNEEVLILNKLVKDDGTIDIIDNKVLGKDEVKDILNKNISKYFDDHFDKWLKKNMPNYLDKYFKDK